VRVPGWTDGVIPPGGNVMASKNLYVGNLPFSTTEQDLSQLFGQYGTVTKAQVIMDRETGRSRGFGFVEMSSGTDEAIQALNGAEYQGRRLTVNEAKPREERPRGGGGGGYGGGGGGRGGYGGGGGGRGGYGGGGGGGRGGYGGDRY
jgi:RNA recognition motif-containing protein